MITVTLQRSRIIISFDEGEDLEAYRRLAVAARDTLPDHLRTFLESLVRETDALEKDWIGRRYAALPANQQTELIKALEGFLNP
jgi:hypothetical protein